MSKESGDPYLRAALRHASDHDTAPPAALEQRILAAAHAATHAAVRAQPWWRRALSALDGLLQPAPAAAFATVMLGTVVALMWRGELAREAMPDVPPPPAEAKAERADTAKTAAPQVPPSGVPAPARQRAAKPAAPPPPPLPTKALPAPVIEAAPQATAVGAASVRADAAPLATPDAAPPSAPTATPRAARLALAETAASDPLAPVFSRLASDDARLSILRELHVASRGRWQRAESLGAGDGQSHSFTDTDGQAIGRLRLDDGAAWWFAADGSTWRATLASSTLASLRERLAR